MGFSIVILGIIFLSGVLAYYYLLVIVKRPRIYVRDMRMHQFLHHLPILGEYYWPTIFYWEGKLQTYFGLTKRHTSPHRLPFQRTLIELSDGGELALDVMEPIKSPVNKKDHVVVLLLPGVSSSSRTSYIRTLVRAINRKGATSIVCNNRGFAGLRLKTPRTHSARNVEDLRDVITHLKNVYPDEKIVALGTSLGGVVLCHYLIDYPEESAEVFTTALLLSTVWDYYGAMMELERGIFNRQIINKGLAKDLVYRVLREKEIFSRRKCWDWNKIEGCKSGREFDTHFHVPQWGYKSAEEYWSDCTLLGKIHRFAIPVFSLNAFDDPMMPGMGLPYCEAEADDSKLALIVTNRGGHLGFLEGFRPISRQEHYMERFTAEFIRAVQLYPTDLINPNFVS